MPCAQNNFILKLDVVGNITYIGEAEVNTLTSTAGWRIKRITTYGNDLVVEWANGNTQMINIWDNRFITTYV